MIKLKKFLLILIVICVVIVFFLFLKPAEIKVIDVPGFELAEAELKRKYGDKKTFSREELDEMDKDVKALTEEKIKKYKAMKDAEKADAAHK